MQYNSIFKIFLLPMIDKFYNINIGNYLSALEASQWWSTSDLIAYQEKKLRSMIEHVYANVPYYRKAMIERGLSPQDIRKIDDLPKLPVLTREIVRNNARDLLSIDFDERKTRVKSTGGTTGEPLRYFIDWEAWSHITACRYRGQGFGGYRLGDKIVTLAGSSLIPNLNPGAKERWRWKLERNLPLSAVHMTTEIMTDFYKKLGDFEPRYIIGYPTALFVFADFIKQNQFQLNNIRAIFTTAEVLQQKHKETIEKVFQCSIFDAYGCGDGGVIATECPEHRGLHLAMEHSIVEVLGKDTNPIKTGSGSIAVTNLHNYAQPFIRYEVGDYANISRENCSCGRGLSLINSIDGRKTDILGLNNGVTLSGPAITLMFRETKILQYQLVQEDGDTLTVNLRKSEDTSEKDIEHVMKLLNLHVGSGVHVITRVVDDIPPTKSGKRNFIISKSIE